MKKLILLPNVLHEESIWNYIPPSIDALIAESEKGGRRFLKRFHLPSCPVYLLNEHTQKPSELLTIKEANVGLISDAGLPCIADPGAALVQLSRQKGVEVEALPGPCSLLLALQLSGLGGQSFTFHGYFPREEREFLTLLKQMGSETHLFIETPYKTHTTLEMLLKHLPRHTQLCVAYELMSPHAYVRTETVEQWKKTPFPHQKGRAVYLISMRRSRFLPPPNRKRGGPRR